MSFVAYKHSYVGSAMELLFLLLLYGAVQIAAGCGRLWQAWAACDAHDIAPSSGGTYSMSTGCVTELIERGMGRWGVRERGKTDPESWAWWRTIGDDLTVTRWVDAMLENVWVKDWAGDRPKQSEKITCKRIQESCVLFQYQCVTKTRKGVFLCGEAALWLVENN